MPSSSSACSAAPPLWLAGALPAGIMAWALTQQAAAMQAAPTALALSSFRTALAAGLTRLMETCITWVTFHVQALLSVAPAPGTALTMPGAAMGACPPAASAHLESMTLAQHVWMAQ
jgi:hypothetical protein